MKILISGASGLVGKALARRLQEDGHTVARLVRPGGRSFRGDIFWDPMAAAVDAPAMEGFDAVIHLSGASIAEGRWTPERKSVLRSSRLASTRVLVDTLSGAAGAGRWAARVSVLAEQTADLEFRLLGPLEVSRDREPVPVDGPHLRALLRNAAMDRTASVRTGEYVLPSRRRVAKSF